MGGPIVRSGASSEYSKNWDNVFGSKKKKKDKPEKAVKAKKGKQRKSGSS